MNIHKYCTSLPLLINEAMQPWEMTSQLSILIEQSMSQLSSDYLIKDGIAIHQSAAIEPTAQIKSPAIIGARCFIGSHTLIRGGVILGDDVSIGPGCEVKTSIICGKTALGHFNFVGDSILGSNVNLEAGAITANYHNDRDDKTIYVVDGEERITTSVKKFGALIGDGSKIGANAVTCPGTILEPDSTVDRLELIRQD